MTSTAISFEAGQQIDGRVICGAKTQAGKPCKRSPAQGRTRCMKHGGATPRGLAHPSTTHGRYSKSMPTRMVADYEAALADPNLLSTRDDIAKLTARQADLLKRVDSGEAGVLWGAMRKALVDFRKARAGGDVDKMNAAMGDLEAAVAAGNSDYTAWRELMAVTEQVRKLRETERKLLEAHNAVITKEQAIIFARSILHAVNDHVEDRKTLAKISNAIDLALGAMGGPS